MILDIENLDGEKLRISYFNKEGKLDFYDLPVPPSQRYNWIEINPGSKYKPDPEYRSWDDKDVAKIRTSKLNKYRFEEIITNFANTNPEEAKKFYDFNIPDKYYLDIETEIVDGFPDAESAKTPVTSISMVGNKKRTNLTFGLKDISEADVHRIESEINNHFSSIDQKFNFKYKKFNSEYDMLYEFFSKAIKNMPLLTGWNFIDYDWKYLINRAKKLNIDPGMASPSGKLLGKNQLPQHRLIVDYLEVYKKWDRIIKIKESNKLDYVGEAALGIKKLSYQGSLKELYERDFEKFIMYNAIDTNLVLCIDEKLQTLLTFFKLAYISKVEINRAFSPIWITEALMSRKFIKDKKVFVWKDKDQEQSHYEGAYVKEPIKGLHKYVTCYDFASLYPSIMLQFNISPESYQGKGPVNKEGLIKTSSEAYFNKPNIRNKEGKIISPGKDSILKEILEDFYEKRISTKDKYLQVAKEINLLEKELKMRKS